MKQNKLEKEQSALENNLKETLKNSKGKEVSLTGFFNVSYCNIIFILIELHATLLFFYYRVCRVQHLKFSLKMQILQMMKMMRKE